MNIKLGDRVSDVITGFTGIVTGIHQYLYSDAMCTVQPESLSEGKVMPGDSFYAEQLRVITSCAHVSSNTYNEEGDIGE